MPTPSLRSSGRRPRKGKRNNQKPTGQRENQATARSTSAQPDEHDRSFLAPTRELEHDAPRPPGNLAELSNLGQTERSVVSLDTVFPARDSSLWTVVRLALWLVYGSLAVARLTGLLHSTMNVCVTSETPGWYPALQNNSHIDHTIQMLSLQNLHCLLTVWMVGPWRCTTRVTSATRTRH